MLFVQSSSRDTANGSHLLASLLQVFVPYISLLVRASDPLNNDFEDRVPWLQMALDKQVVQPQDVLVINSGVWYYRFHTDLYAKHTDRWDEC